MNWKNKKFGKVIDVLISAMLSNAATGCTSSVDFTPPPGSSDMAITHYSFGEMVVDGKTFEDDLVISAGKTIKNWRMRVQHSIDLEDVRDLMGEGASVLIIGIGAMNACLVADGLRDDLKSKGIELHVLRTDQAVKCFNASLKQGPAACFHLNC